MATTKKRAAAKKPARKKAPVKKAPAPKKKAPVEKQKTVAKDKPAAKKKTAPVKKAVKKVATNKGPSWLSAFLETLPPLDAKKPSSSRLEVLEDRLPEQLLEAWRRVGWGRFGDGFVSLVDPTELEDILDEWLGGPNPNRTPLGHTALGDLLYFRDLRQRARELGLSGPIVETACDVSVVDVRHKRVSVIATSVEAFFCDTLGSADALTATLRKDLFDAALPRLGVPERGEIYGFVPALALGGAEDPDKLNRVRTREHLSLLFGM